MLSRFTSPGYSDFINLQPTRATFQEFPPPRLSGRYFTTLYNLRRRRSFFLGSRKTVRVLSPRLIIPNVCLFFLFLISTRNKTEEEEREKLYNARVDIILGSVLQKELDLGLTRTGVHCHRQHARASTVTSGRRNFS